jgi:hypothetical protein
MLWVFFGLMMAMMWSRRWWSDGSYWSGRGRRRKPPFFQEYDDRIAALEADIANRDETISLLESRVNELESRLDFTERLMLQPKADSTITTS